MRAWVFYLVLAAGVQGCRASDFLHTSAPAGVTSIGSLGGIAGAEALRTGAIGQFNVVFAGGLFSGGGQVPLTGLFSDEFTSAIPYDVVPVDSRTADLPEGLVSGHYATDPMYVALHQARLSAFVGVDALRPYGTKRDDVGQLWTVAGFVEVFLAEDYCAGVPLGTLSSNGGTVPGVQLTMDSLLGHAAADFDSARVYATSGDTVSILAAVGLARALLDRGQYAAAQAVAATVPVGFVYNTQLSPNATGQPQVVYGELAANRYFRVSDREGINGLNFVSGHDPRVPIDSSLGVDQLGRTFYYPAQFPVAGATVPLATGTEAQLIVAEAQLAGNDVNGWAATLNGLRSTFPDTALSQHPLPADSTTAAPPATRVDVLFRERAFWLFGMGHRMGDLRRLVRQYGRDPNTVFPVGPYPLAAVSATYAAPPTFGSDVNFPILAIEQANPNFHGCLSHGA